MKRVLSIAGFDPTNGAGVGLDSRIIERAGAYPVSVITNLTVQDTNKVYRVEPVDLDIFDQSLDKVFSDISIDSIKIGLLMDERIMHILVRYLKQRRCPIVLDPMISSSSGYEFLTAKSKEFLVHEIFPLTNVITPNLIEAKHLSGEAELQEMLYYFHNTFKNSVVIKGGHKKGKPIDTFYDGKEITEMSHERLPYEIHGTGCAFSSLLATYLANGICAKESFLKASQTLHQMICEAKSIGKGARLL